MFVVLCSLSLAVIGYYYYSRLNRLTIQLIASNDNNGPLSDYRLEAFNIICHQSTWIPVFIKVYLIGIVETLYIVCCKRGLFGAMDQSGNEAQVDALIPTLDENRLAVITGGDSGIGFEICKGLLLANFHVIIGARSISLCEAEIKKLKAVTGSDKISCVQVDLTSFESVRRFAEEIKNRNIQLLINNAGVMNVPYAKTKDGYESQCQINYLSPFYLTQLLLPYIDTKSGRVLFASSSTMYAARDLKTSKPMETYLMDGLGHYAYSKSCVAHLVQELAKTTSIPVYSYHPGTVRTKLFAHTTVFNLPLMSRLFDFIMLSPKEGSKTPLYLCLTKELGQSGTYWANERAQNIPRVSINGKEGDVKSLWSDTLTKCKVIKN